MGIGFTVLIDRLTDASGVSTPFVTQDPSLPQHCTTFRLGPNSTIQVNEFNTVLLAVIKDHRIFQCLRDLIDSITLPHVSATNCAVRCIEGRREIFAGPGIPREQAWALMRSNLGASREFIRFITDAPRGPRHGDQTHIPGTVTTELTKRTWILMNRFPEYKNGATSHFREMNFRSFPDQRRMIAALSALRVLKSVKLEDDTKNSAEAVASTTANDIDDRRERLSNLKP